MARILTVDDQPHITACLQLFLERQGHEVQRARDGATALERLRSERFDILLTDVDMPGMDGLTLISHDDAMRNLRVILVLTGRTDYEKLAGLQNDKRVHLAPKPFSPSTIAQQIEEALASPADQANGASLGEIAEPADRSS